MAPLRAIIDLKPDPARTMVTIILVFPLYFPWNRWLPEALIDLGRATGFPIALMSNVLPCFGIFLALVWLELIHSFVSCAPVR